NVGGRACPFLLRQRNCGKGEDDCQSENEVVVFHAGEAMADVNFEQAESGIPCCAHVLKSLPLRFRIWIPRLTLGMTRFHFGDVCSIFFRLVVIVSAWSSRRRS